MRSTSTSNHNRKLRLRDVIEREGKSERTIARDVERGHLPAPHYDETGHRFWYEHDLDANDRRVEALKLGPKHRPPPPAPKRRKPKPRIVAPSRRKRQAEHAESVP